MVPCDVWRLSTRSSLPMYRTEKGEGRMVVKMSIPETSFKFPCFRALNLNMGKVDASVNCTELAVRRFVSEAREAADLRSYVQSLSGEYGVRVDHVDLDTLRLRVSHLYVLSVYQQAEEFFRRFREEHPQSGSWTDDPQLPLFEKLLRNIGPTYAATRAVVGDLEISIFDHYREIRNRFMHTEADEGRADRRLEKTANKLREATQERQDYARPIAPNGYHEISFDDFILFTKTVKRIARAMCRAGRPTDLGIVRMVERLDKQEGSEVDLKKHFNRYADKPERLRNALAGILFYQFDLDREESEPIIDLMLSER